LVQRGGSEQAPRKSTLSLSCHTGAAVVVLVVVVDVRKWTAPTSPQKNLQKKDERYSRLAVLGPERLLVLRLLCRDREEMLTRTQAGADLDRTALTLSPATTRRHTPRPHHRGVL
jgi:hypothetical protein